MQELTRDESENILIEGQKLNDGRWIPHSINVAKAAERLAENLGLDKDKAYIYGLLHDIGRRTGIMTARHTIEGYNYMKTIGHEEVGRYCLTHPYFVKDIDTTLGKWDMTEDETKFIVEYLDNTEYTLYDRIIQTADYMGLPSGITLIDRRIIDIHLRYGFNEKTLDNWKAIFKVQAEIEEKLGYSIYKLFPEINEGISDKLIKDVLIF